jgi:hypothetical protein
MPRRQVQGGDKKTVGGFFTGTGQLTKIYEL